MSSIRDIVRSRGWKLPVVTTDQVETYINRLNNKPTKDYYGLTSNHFKKGGSIVILYVTKYINLCFQWIKFGVPTEDTVYVASLGYKGPGKPVTHPNSFRIITVSAFLGKLKEMATCDVVLPILPPFKSPSQLGFTAGLFVKLANILVTEK